MSAPSGFDPFMSASDLARLISARELSPVEVAESYLERVDEFNGEINAFIWRDDEQTISDAKEAEKRIMAGEELPPFIGVPLPIKDLVNVSGQPNTRGARAIPDTPQKFDDPVVKCFRKAGFTFMGRTNTPESGMLQVTENSRFGVTRNPWNLDRTSGGSSGGASAAVAAGMAPIASASDGGGSIRIPAACTGLIGLKPSRGRVPVVSPGWEAGSTAGFVTRTMEDTSLSFSTICGDDKTMWLHAPELQQDFMSQTKTSAPKMRIGLLFESPNGAPVDPECVAATEAVAKVFAAMGHEIVPVDADIVSAELIDLYLYRVIAAALNTVPYTDEELIEPFIKQRIDLGRSINSGDYAKAVFRIHQLAHASKQHWENDFDVLLTPTLATKVPQADFGLKEANRVMDGSAPLEAQMLGFTLFVNVLGLPAISLPVALDSESMPVGVQLIAKQYDELTLLQLGNELERHYEWQNKVPTGYQTKF